VASAPSDVLPGGNAGGPAAATPVASLDEIYLIDSTEQPPFVYPVRLGNRLYRLPEFDAWFDAQYTRLYEADLKA
jgi:hypothetical protein